MEVLLNKVGVIDYKYEELKKQNTFNIFNILRNSDDEINLHSRFIMELLNPQGSHKAGSSFLKSFLETCGINNFPAEGTQVYKEYRNIDILIRNGNKAIVIENKIWAGDQKDQLDRYYKTLLLEGVSDITLIYLTLDGKEPSDYSLGPLKNNPDLKEILLQISYSFHITTWLDNCIKEVSVIPTLRETLVQYKNLVNDLTGQSMSAEEVKEMMNLFAKNDNMVMAGKIANNWGHVKWHTEWQFWNELEAAVKEEFEILPIQKYSSDNLNSVIHHTRNRNPWYGIMFKVGQNEQDKICIFIERGWGNMYYGVTILDAKDSREATEDPKYKALAEKVKVFSADTEKGWMGWNHFQDRIDFQNFSDENTLRLINPEFRKESISKIIKEVKNYIKACELDSFKPQFLISEN